MSEQQVLFDVPGPRAIRRDRLLSIATAIVLAGLLAWVVITAYQRGIFDDRWSVLWDPPKNQTAADVWTTLLWKGLVLGTLKAVSIAVPIVAILSVALTIARVAPYRLLRAVAYLYTHAMRGIPVLLVIFFGLVGLRLSPLMAVVLGLVAYNTAVVAEILRAGIAALPSGQREAGLAIGLTPLQTMLRIQLPQAVRIMLPALVSQVVVLLKDTSLGFIIAYVELLHTVKNLYNYFGESTQVVFVLVGAAIYIPVNMLVSWLAHRLEARTRARRRVLVAPGADPDELLDVAATVGVTAKPQ